MIAIFALTATVNAQDKMGKKGRHHKKQGREMISKQLNFSEEQKKQSKTINADFRKKMQELNKNENITVKEQREKKSAILKERKARMHGLLTAEQRTKLAQLKVERKVKKEERYANRLDKMKTRLGLTDEQVSKLKDPKSSKSCKS